VAQQKIPVAECYSVAAVAELFGVGRWAVRGLIDAGKLASHCLPGRRPRRRIAHQAVIAFLRRPPESQHCLDRLDGEPIEFSPGPRPACWVRTQAPPRSPHRPRGLSHGKVPRQPHYSLSQVGYVLGCHRRTVWERVNSGQIRALKLPTATAARHLGRSWHWRITHSELVRYLTSQGYTWAMRRLAPESPSQR
jgi:hypothetical protein